MDIKIIKTKAEYRRAMKRLEVIFDAKPGTKEGDELEILSLLVDHFEREHFPIETPDPIEAIRFRMDQMGYKQKDLEKVIGNKSRISEILNRKRKLTVEMIRKLHSALDIPLDALIQEYKLTG